MITKPKSVGQWDGFATRHPRRVANPSHMWQRPRPGGFNRPLKKLKTDSVPRSAYILEAVNDGTPTCTIVVPTRPGADEVAALTASRALDYPREKLEVIVARGRQPAVQRNAALRAARGELVYFLDDDSRPRPENLRQALAHFQDPSVQMVGGPNLCPPEAPRLERVFAVVLSSWVAFGPSRARYAPVGRARPAS